jgi:hypothetical protein
MSSIRLDCGLLAEQTGARVQLELLSLAGTHAIS